MINTINTALIYQYRLYGELVELKLKGKIVSYLAAILDKNEMKDKRTWGKVENKIHNGYCDHNNNSCRGGY